jgi:hypothetical protein
MENCCGEAATLTVPAPPELWEVINEETFTEAFTSLCPLKHMGMGQNPGT